MFPKQLGCKAWICSFYCFYMYPIAKIKNPCHARGPELVDPALAVRLFSRTHGFRGSSGISLETSIYPEYRKVSGVHILQLYFNILHNS